MQHTMNPQREGETTNDTNSTFPNLGSGMIHLEQLASENLDIKRWINTSLQALAPSDGTRIESDMEREARVVKLFNRLQTYSQEVSGSVEDTITQALVRLPRTGLEVGRMATEAQQLQQQLQTMQEVVQPAVEAASKPYVAQLNAYKKTQEKLSRCSDMLRKASKVDSNMKQLDDVMQQLRTSPSEVNMDLVAEAISQVRRNLAELQKFEVTFGEKQLEAVEKYEQIVQHALEVDCMEQLRRREVERASHLLSVLDTIGRADAVLQQYASESMMNEKELVDRFLRGIKNSSDSNTFTISPARVAEVLKEQLMPSISHTLGDQIEYFLQMLPMDSGEGLEVNNIEKGTGKPQEAELRTIKVLKMMVIEISGTIADALGPILEKVERNQELVACCDAVRQLKITSDVSNNNKSNINVLLWDKIVKQISAYAHSEMIQIFSQNKILEAFAQREAHRVKALLKDPNCIMKRERFRAVMDTLIDAIKSIIHFFPDKTLPICIEKWREAILKTIFRLRPVPKMPQSGLLERLSASRTVVRQLILTSQKSISDYLNSPELQRLCPSIGDTVDNKLRTQLWAPLTEALENCVSECQQALKRTIIEPVIMKAKGYDSQSLWGSKQGESSDDKKIVSPSLPYTPAQISPSELVRALGEAIVEIPLALEALRGDGDTRLDGIEELLEEVAESWLDDIVRAAVTDFIETKVGNITIYFPSNLPNAEKKEAAAVEQLATDLGYLKSVLAAVSDDPFEELEQALVRVKAIGLPSGKPISARQLIAEGGVPPHV